MLLLFSLPDEPARAHSVCGCDPAASTLGMDRPSLQSLRVQLEDRYLAKESGASNSAESGTWSRGMIFAGKGTLLRSIS